MLSPDDTHVFIVVAERPAGAKSTIVPNYVTETGYTEDIPARTNVGDTQDRRLLAILNLKTGKTVWADGSFAPPVADDGEACRQRGRDRRRTASRGAAAEREIRWSMPVVSDDGKLVVAAARSADNKDRWFVTARSRDRQDERHRHAARRRVDPRSWAGSAAPSVEFLPDNKRVWFLSERDGWMHLYTLDVSGRRRQAEAADAGQVGDHVRRRCRATARSSTSRRPRCIPASGTSTRCRSTAARARRSRR